MLLKLSCCIEMIFTEYPFLERIRKAKDAGFDAVEFWTWQDKDIDAIEKAAREAGITVATFQGNIRGTMVDADDRAVYIEDVKRSLAVAKRLGAKSLFCMSDMLQEDRSIIPHKRPLCQEEMYESTVAALKELAPLAEAEGICLVIEPLNTLVDHKGYSLFSSKEALDIVQEVNSPCVRLLYDAYHMQIMEGNIIETIQRNAYLFGHFHLADVPGRHQPGTGEMNYRNILAALRDARYHGMVGFEFEPIPSSDDVVPAIVSEVRSVLEASL